MKTKFTALAIIWIFVVFSCTKDTVTVEETGPSEIENLLIGEWTMTDFYQLSKNTYYTEEPVRVDTLGYYSTFFVSNVVHFQYDPATYTSIGSYGSYVYASAWYKDLEIWNTFPGGENNWEWSVSEDTIVVDFGAFGKLRYVLTA